MKIVVHNYLPARDAGRVTYNFGSNRAKGEVTAKANAAVSKEEWSRRASVAQEVYRKAIEEGNRRKDSKGAFPKDVLRRMTAAQKELDLARQFGGVN